MLKSLGFSRVLSTTPVVEAALPALVKRLTRRATLRHLQNIKAQKEKHGDKFKFLEKHKRYPGLPGYVAPAALEPLTLTPVPDACQYNITPLEIEFILKSLPEAVK